ncbi:ribosomal protein L5 [Sistotremastrum suecicum HHB10207 ss-3]|uniref:Ribosomal protein L5 n=1 Tax=Sistotremastrum suecicum HHB10207 ss-3 TaxID=1314776 RepID=A0A166FG24_9AGAM|nr:ribosomal protein L5 [Sistotremastrum suecicum HHB10207 ss-3]
MSLKDEPRWRRRTLLPTPPCNVVIRDTHASRLADHYHNTLKDDLMYLNYHHESKPRPEPRQIRLTYDPENPYTKNRKNLPVGGSRLGKKPLPPDAPENVIRLERIQLHCMVKEAIANRSNLLPAIMAFRALSGETQGGGGRHTREGVQVVRGKSTEGGWIRPGLPCGVKVDMKGEKMWTFLSTLVDFVLPRMKEFSGVLLPAPSASPNTPSAVSGVVSFGLPPAAMALFPQIEVNVDAYTRMHGFHIHFITNAQGVGAQARARALLSGFQIPFARR